VSYVLEPAQILIVSENIQMQQFNFVVSDLMKISEFEDLGRDDEMIDLLRFSESKSGLNGLNNSSIERLQNEYTYLNRKRGLTVVISDFRDTRRDRQSSKYAMPSGPYLEISIYESRPGGFSAFGQQFVSGFKSELVARFGDAVIQVTPTPPTNDAEYWRVTTINMVAGAIGWSIAFGVGLLITSPISFYALRKLPVRTGVKRAAFTLVSTWLVTPMPFPAASILVIALPHVFAAPWTDLDYYEQVKNMALYSFPISMIFCAIISVRVFRRSDDSGVAAG